MVVFLLWERKQSGHSRTSGTFSSFFLCVDTRAYSLFYYPFPFTWKPLGREKRGWNKQQRGNWTVILDGNNVDRYIYALEQDRGSSTRLSQSSFPLHHRSMGKHRDPWPSLLGQRNSEMSHWLNSVADIRAVVILRSRTDSKQSSILSNILICI